MPGGNLKTMSLCMDKNHTPLSFPHGSGGNPEKKNVTIIREKEKMKNVNRIMTINRTVIILLLLMLILPGGAFAQEKKRNVQSDRYIINQTFDGQAFFKDNNVWVYNQKFADTFGMPPEGVYNDLKGIEAAAFRIEDCNYKMCGMGSKTENCKDNYRCVADIYIDETKTPLPWSTDQKADWLNDYNSLLWLQLPPAPKTPEEIIIDKKEKTIMYKPNQGGRYWTPVAKNVIPNIVPNHGFFSLRPFADPETHREVNWFHNATNDQFDDKGVVSLANIYGYKRQAIAGLTMISLGYNCLGRNDKKTTVTFRLESREEVASPTLKRFHEFQLPNVFLGKIDEVLKVKKAKDEEYYKALLKSINKP